MKSRTRSSGGTLIRVLIIIILTVLIGGVLLFNFFFKTDGSPSSVFGIYFLRTKETSMIPEIKDGDMIIGMKTDPEKIAADDVIICQIVTRITVMRVVSVDDSTSPPAFSVKYDTVPMSDAFLISSDSVIAKAYFKSAFLGQLLDVATSVPGIIVAVIIPLTLIIIYQITRFAKDRGDDRGSDEDEDDYDGSEGFRRGGSKSSARLTERTAERIAERTAERIAERTADLTEMLSERALDDPAISLSAFVPEKTKPETEKKLSIDSRGRAEVKETKKLPPADSVTRQIAINAYQRYQTPEEAKKQLYSGVAPRSMTAGYKNESAPVIFLQPQSKPASPKTVTRIDDLVKAPPPVQTAPSVQGVSIGQGVPGGQIVQPVQEVQPEQPSDLLTPKPASVIPDSIIRAQETAVETGSPGSTGSTRSNNTSGFDESVREYFRKEPVDIPGNLPEQVQPDSDIIPPGAVAPKVNIAPVRRKKSTRTVDELMKIIDAQTDKLK